VAQRLEALGFTVPNLPNPDWTRDKIILACELVEANGWRQVDASDPRVKALSELLQSSAIHPSPRSPDFGNPAGVAFKTYNIASTHPDDYCGPQTPDDFRGDPAGMRSMAARIRELLTAVNASAVTELPDGDHRLRG
jgi:5-methylcytosine-specific restriction enzyme A